jgi:uncharacterized protein
MPTIAALMSAAFPETVDAWRMVANLRRFHGSLPIATLPRLCQSLAHADGELRYELSFGRDALGVAFLDVRVEGALALTCQRTLDVFAWPVSLTASLGLIRQEADESALPPGYEALLVGEGEVRLADVIEDELMLALPLVPIKSVEGESSEWAYSTENAEPPAAVNPFAVLSSIKKRD